MELQKCQKSMIHIAKILRNLFSLDPVVSHYSEVSADALWSSLLQRLAYLVTEISFFSDLDSSYFSFRGYMTATHVCLYASPDQYSL